MSVSNMKNLLHLPLINRIPSVHPAKTNATLSQSSISMTSNGASQHQDPNANRSATLNGPLMGAASMGDIKQTKISTIVSKKANRAKEIFLQNLGKAEKTKDELFEMYQGNFCKQQSHALKLHKEIKNYIQCLRTMQEATKSLNVCLQESHGNESPRHDLFCENIAEIEQLYEHLSEKLKSNLLANIEEYLSQFSEIREKISKRGRKLIDYDSAKRSYELLQAANNKKPLRDEARLNKSREQYEVARQMYQNLNNELHNELPALYESRIPYILLTLQTYCNTQINFHQTNVKLYSSCHDAIDLLATLSSSANQKHNNNNNCINNNSINSNNNSNSGSLANKFCQNEIKSDYANGHQQEQQQQPQQPQEKQTNGVINCVRNGDSVYSDPRSSSSASSSLSETSVRDQLKSTINSPDPQHDASQMISAETVEPSNQEGAPHQQQQQQQQVNGVEQQVGENGIQNGCDVVAARGDKRQSNQNGIVSGKMPQVIPNGATTCDLPEGVLYKVKTSYKYMAEDVDELCFEADEILHVIEYEDPQEQEEGWLMGVREVNGQRGLFPANFTRPI